MMKKTNILTVSIIAMMAVGAARADIASTNYVNAQIQPVSQALSGKQDKSNMKGSDAQELLGSVLESDTYYLSAKGTAAVITDMLDERQAGTTSKGSATVPVYFDSTGTAQPITSYSGKAATAGTADVANSVTWANVSGKPSTFTPSAHNQASSTINELTGYTKGSSSEALSASDSLNVALGKLENKSDSLKNRMDTAEGDISQLETDVSTLISDSQEKSTADYQVGKQGGGWTTLDAGQIAAINSGATSALVGKISTNEAAINTLNGSGAGSVANSIATALTPYSTTSQMNAELAKKQNALTAGDRITITTNAQTGDLIISAADQSYSDTALSNRVTAIEQSAAYTSGIDSTKVAQIATNASDISDLQSGKQDKIDAQHKLSTDLIANDAGYITKDVNNLTNYTTTTAMNTALGNKQDKIDAQHKLSTDVIANDAGYITKDVNNLTNYTTTTALNTSLSGKQPVSSGVSVGGANGSWNSLTNGSGITITTNNGTTTIATATSYVPMPSAAGTTGKSVLTYDSTANSGAGAYYWEEIGR